MQKFIRFLYEIKACFKLLFRCIVMSVWWCVFSLTRVLTMSYAVV
uniref:Uncharacterized protein n=1 Tax=Siphoviridae sp. ctP0x5 TaxID=2827863 RepID=A0A8S5TFU3_9CAUD|nr:MAG TPA: hypothetical protein [Siphoviridae sp. ctP0x5]